MYEYIRGKVTAVEEDYTVIENSGIGYRVYTAYSTLANLKEGQNDVMLHTCLYLREGVMDLYGFLTRDEMSMFRLLLMVSGVGPRAAVSVISAIGPAEFALAVISDDVKTLTKAPGIGQKTAQKIILELKDRISREQFAAVETNVPSGDGDSVFSEATNALRMLGYTQLEANRAVAAAGSDDDLETVIKKALKILASGRL